jgi:glycosyltransferase involved in cell wall biosynthesis
MSKVCAIIPNYCHEQYLELRIESIINQTYNDLDILILDDASTDNSKKVIEKYVEDNRIKVIYNDKNSGSVFSQWELGINRSDSEFVWIAESDDWAELTFLENLVPVLEEREQFAIAYCQSNLVDIRSKITGNAACWTNDLDSKKWESDFTDDGMSFIEHYLSTRNVIPNASAVLQRRSILEQCLPIEKTFKLCGDWYHWVRMLELGDVSYVAKSLNNWRLNSSNVRSRPPGVFEWTEGECILSEIGRILRYSDHEILSKKHNFLKQCFSWLSDHSLNQEGSK